MTIPVEKWEWRGDPGHFVCNSQCRFKLHTHIGRFCISTVGEYFPRGEKEMEWIGGGPEYFYETMIFIVDEHGDWIDEVYPNHVDCDNDRRLYKVRDEASTGHLAACNEYAERQ